MNDDECQNGCVCCRRPPVLETSPRLGLDPMRNQKSSANRRPRKDSKSQAAPEVEKTQESSFFAISHIIGAVASAHRNETEANEELSDCMNWFSTLPSDEWNHLKNSPEYEAFAKSLKALKRMHHQTQDTKAPSMSSLRSRGVTTTSPSIDDPINFGLSRVEWLSEELWLNILSYLPCQTLLRARITCSRFCRLTEVSATRRCQTFVQQRLLSNVFQLLLAKEQLQGSINCRDSSSTATTYSPHVPIPILLLPRRVVVTDCGDPEFNGIYYCTGCNGNGFLFTKPRNPPIRMPITQQWESSVYPDEVLFADGDAVDQSNNSSALLRCIISKRFSDETILWYMSKEVVRLVEEELSESDASNVDHRGDETRPAGADERTVSQLFCFWAHLMVLGDASSDLSRYPSQTSILQRSLVADARRNDDDEEEELQGWQSLPTMQSAIPPTVELLD